MREYKLSDPEARADVDLTDYEDVIKKAVAKVNDEAVVEVFKDRYTIDGITRSESVQIGRQLSKTALAEYCVKVELSRLFFGHEVEEESKWTK